MMLLVCPFNIGFIHKHALLLFEVRELIFVMYIVHGNQYFFYYLRGRLRLRDFSRNLRNRLVARLLVLRRIRPLHPLYPLYPLFAQLDISPRVTISPILGSIYFPFTMQTF